MAQLWSALIFAHSSFVQSHSCTYQLLNLKIPNRFNQSTVCNQTTQKREQMGQRTISHLDLSYVSIQPKKQEHFYWQEQERTNHKWPSATQLALLKWKEWSEKKMMLKLNQCLSGAESLRSTSLTKGQNESISVFLFVLKLMQC